MKLLKLLLIIVMLSVSASISLQAAIIVTASSVQTAEHQPSCAADSDIGTRWSSEFKDNQWIMFDLGEEKNIAGIKLYWEYAYAKEYRILNSINGNDWTISATKTNGIGNTEFLVFKQVKTRYIKIELVKRATEYGFSIYECEFLSKQDIANLPVPRYFPDIAKGIHIISIQRFPTDKSAKFLAEKCDIIGRFGISSDEERKRIRNFNPRAILLAYIDVWHSPYNKETIQDESEFLIDIDMIMSHLNWILKATNGNRITVGGWRPLMDPANQEWRDYVAKQVIYATDGQPNGYVQKQIINEPYDGVILDEPHSSLDFLRMRGTAIPVNPRTGKEYTEEEWHNDWRGFVKYVNDALKKRWPKNPRKGYVIINGIDAYEDNPNSSAMQKDILQFADLGAIEGFVHSYWTAPDSWYTWERCIQNMEYAESFHKASIVVTGTKDGNPVFNSCLHMYGLASYLMGKGNNSYFLYYTENLNFSGVLYDAKNMPYWWKGWSVDIGYPVSARKQDDSGVWRREYSGGLVFANPTQQAITVSFGKKYLLLREDGEIQKEPIDKIELMSRTGVILLKNR